MNNLHLGIHEFRQSQILGHIDQLVHFGVDYLMGIAHKGKPNLSTLVDIIGTHLCNGDVKLVPQPGNHRFHYLSLALQRTAIVDSEDHQADTRHHTLPRFQ